MESAIGPLFLAASGRGLVALEFDVRLPGQQSIRPNPRHLREEKNGFTFEYSPRVMRPFVGDAFDEPTFRRLIAEAYSSFETPDVAPLKPLGDSGLYLLELFHGPTLAFKDVALQLLGRMLDAKLVERNRHATIVGATSGDTGSAAIEAVRDRKTIDIFMLFPHGRVSEVQRRQMTTVLAPNVHNIAVAGTFLLRMWI